jgi:hypothetical protein
MRPVDRQARRGMALLTNSALEQCRGRRGWTEYTIFVDGRATCSRSTSGPGKSRGSGGRFPRGGWMHQRGRARCERPEHRQLRHVPQRDEEGRLRWARRTGTHISACRSTANADGANRSAGSTRSSSRGPRSPGRQPRNGHLRAVMVERQRNSAGGTDSPGQEIRSSAITAEVNVSSTLNSLGSFPASSSGSSARRLTTRAVNGGRLGSP